MMQKLLPPIAIILIFTVVGVGYLWLKNIPELDNEIKVGQIPVDSQAIEAIQQQVDQGHQPWRLDPLLVAKNELSQYGFIEEDFVTLTLPPYIPPDLGTQITTIQGEIIHRRQPYLITLKQPVQGQGKLWVVSEIKEK